MSTSQMHLLTRARVKERGCVLCGDTSNLIVFFVSSLRLRPNCVSEKPHGLSVSRLTGDWILCVQFSVPWTLPCQPRYKMYSRGTQVDIFVVHALWFAMIAQSNLFSGILGCVFATASRICSHGNCTVRALRFSEFA